MNSLRRRPHNGAGVIARFPPETLLEIDARALGHGIQSVGIEVVVSRVGKAVSKQLSGTIIVANDKRVAGQVEVGPSGMLVHPVCKREFEAALELRAPGEVGHEQLGRADVVQCVHYGLGQAERLGDPQGVLSPFNGGGAVLRQHVKLRHRAVGHGQLRAGRKLLENAHGLERELPGVLTATAKPSEA